MEIKYRKGYPTKNSMLDIIEGFWKGEQFRPRISSYTNITFIWENKAINLKIPDFLMFLEANGVGVDYWQLSNSPSTGMIRLKKKDA